MPQEALIPPRTVSVVVIAYNQERELPELLSALGRQSAGAVHEVVVVDNMSTDRTGEVAAGYHALLPGLRVVPATSGQGPAYARNAGLAATTGDFVLFLDGDDVPGDRWMERMLAASDRGDLVGGQLEKTLLNDAELVGHPLAFEDAGWLDYSPHGWVVAANIGVWRRVFAAIGGWPEGLVASEDVLFCLRAQAAGFTLTMAEGALVHYRVRQDLRQVVRSHVRYGISHAQVRRELGAPHTHRPSLRPLVPWTRSMAHVLRASPRHEWARLALARELSIKAGRLYGSVRYRTVVL